MPSQCLPPRKRSEAIARRAQMLQRAAMMARYAGDESLPWAKRYEFTVIGDHCLDNAREADDFLRRFFERA
jgi:hypothetical protein